MYEFGERAHNSARYRRLSQQLRERWWKTNVGCGSRDGNGKRQPGMKAVVDCDWSDDGGIKDDTPVASRGNGATGYGVCGETRAGDAGLPLWYVRIADAGRKKELRWRGMCEHHQRAEDLKAGLWVSGDPCLLAGTERGGCGPNVVGKLVLRLRGTHLWLSHKNKQNPRASSFSAIRSGAPWNRKEVMGSESPHKGDEVMGTERYIKETMRQESRKEFLTDPRLVN